MPKRSFAFLRHSGFVLRHSFVIGGAFVIRHSGNMRSTPLTSDVIARIDHLELEARQVVEGYLAGRHKSPRHGFAVEFAQHREYAPGDDIKHIDWKVYARTERYHLKQYEQETNLVAWLVVDASESMRYGSAKLTKYDLACSAAAAMG